MKSNAVSILIVLIVVESLVLIVLISNHVTFAIRKGIMSHVPPEVANPLYGALEYNSPSATFEHFVKENPGWILFIPPGASNSILAMCAESQRTNYVRILISNGADVKRAINEEKRKRNDKAVELLQQTESELKHL